MDLKVKMAQEIINEVESLPSFPQNILKIQRLCANPESTIKAIADSIKRDPGLLPPY
jgi:HD-like signal output (HDOD) protein